MGVRTVRTVFTETDLGFAFETPEVFGLFGKKSASLNNLGAVLPEKRWARVRQTHSDIVVRAHGPWSEPLTEADAHWTTEKNLGLLISTADCTPVLLFHPRRRAVASIHAGWRGVASRIVPKTLDAWKAEFGDIHGVRAWVGPHIRYDSFEVGADVKDELLLSVREVPEDSFRAKAGGKFDVDLNALVLGQLSESGIPRDLIDVLAIDTKMDLRFHSHRRDRENAGRQLSFISLR